MRKLAVMFDGTDDSRSSHTAIGRLADALEVAEVPVHYERGVHGLRGSLYGHGFGRRVEEALRVLQDNPADRLVIGGFSRGGAEAIALANFAADLDMLPLQTTLVLFDPVKALSHHVASSWDFRQPDCTTFSALARDEARGAFWPVTWKKALEELRAGITQRWFAGRHTDIGGFKSGPALDWQARNTGRSLDVELRCAPPARRHEIGGRIERSLLPRRSRRILVGTLQGEIP